MGYWGAYWGQAGLELDACTAVELGGLVYTGASYGEICDFIQANVPDIDAVTCGFWANAATSLRDPFFGQTALYDFAPDGPMFLGFDLKGNMYTNGEFADSISWASYYETLPGSPSIYDQ